ncbi:MAG: hypothetical protein ABIO16_13750 [Nocardioides sp.]
MSDTSRRKFLAAAGVGAAGTVGLTAVSVGAAEAAPAEATRKTDSAKQPVVAYVEHHFSDRVHLMVGEREIVVHDRDLATRILNAAGGN